MHKEMGRVFSNQFILKDRLMKGSKNFNLRVLELQDYLGNKPLHLMEQFNAPSLWGTVGVMWRSILSIKEEQPQKKNLAKENVKRIALQEGNAKYADLGGGSW